MKSRNSNRCHWLFQFGCALLICSFSLLIVPHAHAAYPELILRYQHYLFSLDPDAFPVWWTAEEDWTMDGIPIDPLPVFRVDGDQPPPLPKGVVRTSKLAWDRAAIRAVLQERIASQLDRAPGSVAIDRDGDGAVTFDGIGLPGRKVLIDQAASLVIAALEQGVNDIILPVQEIQPSITVRDKDLRTLGITEVITVGESNFSGSANARRHNIAVGLEQFNGTLIQPGEEFSFNQVLGPVNASTGYWQELVILGERTLPDYGGGLCQVSTTAYRGAWEYGFPITQRRNHSFAVRYYSPAGTDATIYPPSADMKFLNDSGHAILLQTYVDGDNAYYIYYGTDDGRQSEIIGPYTWGSMAPPPDRTEYTTDIPPGTTRKVGERVPGVHAAWFRAVRYPDQEEQIESFYSIYEARPYFLQIGVESTEKECTTLICS